MQVCMQYVGYSWTLVVFISDNRLMIYLAIYANTQQLTRAHTWGSKNY